MKPEPEQIAEEKGYTITNKGIVISPYKRKVGTYGKNKYLYFGIRYNKKIIKVYFHRFQAYKKFGNQMFDKNLCIRHLDGNFLNNSYSNIEMGTYSQNSLDIPKEIRINISKYANMKYDENLIKSIKEDRYKGMCYKELITKYNIKNKSSLSYILNYR
jgi:hypothetical protein